MAVLLVTTTAATAQGDDEYTRKSLRGLKGVQVVVEGIKPEAEASGLYAAAILTDVELKLRQAGIKVLTGAEARVAPGQPYLYVQVGLASNPKTELYAFFIRVELCQDVQLLRDPSSLAGGIATWSPAGTVGTVGKENLRTLRDNIKDQVDKFINAYLSVNPK
jgi:hypothetical protein